MPAEADDDSPAVLELRGSWSTREPAGSPFHEGERCGAGTMGTGDHGRAEYPRRGDRGGRTAFGGGALLRAARDRAAAVAIWRSNVITGAHN